MAGILLDESQSLMIYLHGCCLEWTMDIYLTRFLTNPGVLLD